MNHIYSSSHLRVHLRGTFIDIQGAKNFNPMCTFLAIGRNTSAEQWWEIRKEPRIHHNPLQKAKGKSETIGPRVRVRAGGRQSWPGTQV